MEVFEKSHYSNFLRHQKSHNENFFELLKGHTLFSTNMYGKVTGIFGHHKCKNMSIFDLRLFKATYAQQSKVLRIKKVSEYI